MQHTDTLPRDVLDLAEEHGIGEQLDAVLELTQQMFPGPMTAQIVADPECPHDRSIVLDVEATGEFRDIIQRECEWHRELQRIIPGHLEAVALSIMPR